MLGTADGYSSLKKGTFKEKYFGRITTLFLVHIKKTFKGIMVVYCPWKSRKIPLHRIKYPFASLVCKLHMQPIQTWKIISLFSLCLLHDYIYTYLVFFNALDLTVCVRFYNKRIVVSNQIKIQKIVVRRIRLTLSSMGDFTDPFSMWGGRKPPS